MEIDYRVNEAITAEQFIAVLKSSGLGERRPVSESLRMQGMVDNSNLLVTAWHKGKLVGVARSLTDFHYACYLSDLAVNQEYQHFGIGKKLQQITGEQLADGCKLILLAAPDANEYYAHLGYQHHPRCWVKD